MDLFLESNYKSDFDVLWKQLPIVGKKIALKFLMSSYVIKISPILIYNG